MSEFFSRDIKSALESKDYAQWIAFSPIIFQATLTLRNLGILQFIEDSGKGVSLEDIEKKLQLPHYGVRVLVEAGLGIGLIIENENKYKLTKTGYFIISDNLTKANMDFTNDVCYEGMFSLEKSIKTGKPEGLKKISDKRTLYEALASLEPHVQKSWLDFDHYYSDTAFPEVLPLVFKNKPKTLLDIGGNTGKWSIACAHYNPEVTITIMDLPGQTNMAKKNIDALGLSDRIFFFQTDILKPELPFPSQRFDAIWMSQFLDCFSDEEIVFILKRCAISLNENGYIYILEPFWDNQRFKTSAFCLQMTSLYFTNIANGNSQMYDSKVFYKLVEQAGLKIEETITEIGVSHTLLKCKRA